MAELQIKSYTDYLSAFQEISYNLFPLFPHRSIMIREILYIILSLLFTIIVTPYLFFSIYFSLCKW